MFILFLMCNILVAVIECYNRVTDTLKKTNIPFLFFDNSITNKKVFRSSHYELKNFHTKFLYLHRIKKNYQERSETKKKSVVDGGPLSSFFEKVF